MPSRRTQVGYLLLGLLVAVIGLSFGGPLSYSGVPEGPRSDGVEEEPTATSGAQPELATVTFRDPDGSELGQIRAMVADTAGKRFTGLSDTESLAEDEGMVFVYAETESRTYVMREMDFPLDIIFVAGDGRITQIHHAPVETDDDLTGYSGQARWVLEVNRGWTTDHDVSVGDYANVTLPE